MSGAAARQRGATLIEMVVSILVISISATATMMVVSQVGRHSADPMRRLQAVAIAQAYMDEILAQSLSDPDGGETGGAEAGETRATFDDVMDYHGLADNAGARDQTGTAIAGLEGYNVAVTIAAATLGGLPARQVRVLVAFDGDPSIQVPLVAYRMN